MALTQRRSMISKAFSVSAVAIAATVLGASSPIAFAAPAAVTPAASVTSLDTPANWAAAHAAAASGYYVSPKLAASCGAKQ